MKKVGRNDLCPCGSTLKYKFCCLNSKEKSESESSILLALKQMQAGEYHQADNLCRQLLDKEPNNADALHLLGLIQQKLKHYAQAEEMLNRSIRVALGQPVYYVNLGNLHKELERFDQAIDCYRKALELDPRNMEAHNNMGIILKDLGRLEEAAAAYRLVIGMDPGYAVAHYNLGDVLKRLGRPVEAMASYRKALSIDPNLANTMLVAGLDCLNAGLRDEAMACFQELAEIKPDFFEAHVNVGVAWFDKGMFDEAIASYRTAIALNPRHAIAHRNLGTALYSQGKYDEALACYRQAVKLKADYYEAHDNLGSVLLGKGQFAEAIASFERALSLRPDYLLACSNLMMTLQYDNSRTNEQVYARSIELGRRFEQAGSPQRPLPAPGLEQGRKVRVGLVSGDLRNHPVGLFLESALHHMDKQAFSFIAYANQSQYDNLSERLRSDLADWVWVRGMPDRELADRIKSDGIDILVDLAGHTADCRLSLFGLGPAPVQLSWIGYANTTGLASMDYILADPTTVPAAEEQFYSEKVWRLPETYLCFTPPAEEIEVSALPVLEQGSFTFGSFSNAAKLNDQVLACWSRILQGVPGSRLFLKFRAFEHQADRDEMVARFQHHGIDAGRLHLEGYSERSDYLAAYRQIDMVLDPFPFPGATTTCEAAWMGVPTLTLPSARGMVGHNGELIMKSIGLDEWVAVSIDDYVEKALSFAAGTTSLSVLRAGLRQRLLDSPLCNGERFARHLGEAFRGMLGVITALQPVGIAAPRGSDDGNLHSPGQLQADPAGLIKQGLSLKTAGKLEEAEAVFLQALVLNPDDALARYQLGDIAQSLGRSEEGLSHCRTAFARDPQLPVLLMGAGIEYYDSGRLDEALECFSKMAAIIPDNHHAWINCGLIHFDQGRIDKSLECYRRALEFNSADVITHNNLGVALYHKGRFNEAVASYRQAIALKPDYFEAYNNLGNALQGACRYGEAIDCFEQALNLNPKLVDAFSNILLTCQYSYDMPIEEAFARSREFGRRFDRADAEIPQFSSLDRVADGPIRVGFVSGDLRNHPVSIFLEAALAQMDRKRFSFVAYANQHRHDEVSERLRPLFADWVAVKGLSDADLAARIRADGIHILVDLSGHTADTRLPVFALKPAPLQVAWIGYPNTTGMTSMDYILGDPVTVPDGEEQFYTEKVWRLPETYLCFTPPNAHLEVSPPPVLENGYITFGCFNNRTKLNDAVIACWAEILRSVPAARLFLKYKSFSLQSEIDDFVQRFADCGIASDRLLFEGYSKRDEYLSTYNRIDFVLDPFPFPGATTSCEAAWMGVPTLTMGMARGMVGHNGELIMKSVGLDEWVAHSVEDYVAKARAFAAGTDHLAAIRASLRQRLLESPLCDAGRFAGHLGDAFSAMLAANA